MTAILVVVVYLFGASIAQDPGCDYNENVGVDQTRYVYNIEYPYNYTEGTTCRWIAKCPNGYKSRLDCSEINLPYSKGCIEDRLLISKTGDPQLNNAEKYCGLGSLSVVSTGPAISVGLITSQYSTGGRFVCSLKCEPSTPTEENCKCGYKKSNRIVGGEETGINEYPMMGGVVDLELVKIKCGCTIISPRHVITAAHCLIDKSVSDIAVVVGEHDVTKGDSSATQGFQVASIRIHPLYNDTNYDNDIAIITLAKNIVFSDRVGPACLPFRFKNNKFTDKNVTALGWGTIYSGGPDSDVLLKADIKVISQAQCKESNPALTPRQMCTFTLGKDSCQDDSGGPLLLTDPATGRLYLVGIISYGPTCGGRKPSFNTRMTEYLNWIVSEIEYNFCIK